MLTSCSLPSLMKMKDGILPRRSSSVCNLIAALVERNGAQGNTDRQRSIVEHRPYLADRAQRIRRRRGCALWRSDFAQSRNRCANHASHWHWRVCCVQCCCESPSDRAWSFAHAGTLQYRGGSHDRSTVRRPCTGTDRDKRTS